MIGPLPGRTTVVVDRSLGEFFREAAVLVGVFGYLDPIFKGGTIGPAWVALIAVATSSLFLIGLFFEVRASTR